MKLQTKKLLLQIGGFLISIAPIVIVVAFNWGDYTSTVARKVSLSIGGTFALILVLLKAMGKMPKDIKPIIRYSIAFVLVLLLDPIIANLKILLGMALLGEVLDVAIFSWQIKKIDREIQAQTTANAMQSQTQMILDAINSQKESQSTDNEGRV